jgi:glycosyltransferase involved in cell wall biosynthesis
MRIGMLTDSWLPNIDGVVNSLIIFRKELEKRGHEIFIFAPGEKNFDDFENNTFYYRSRVLKVYENYKIAFRLTPFFQRTNKLTREVGIDVFHSHSPGPMGVRGLCVAYKLGIPLVFTYHTNLHDLLRYLPLNETYLDMIFNPLLNRWISWYLKGCDAVIVPTRSRADELSQSFGDCIKKLFIQPNPIDFEKFCNIDKEKAIGLRKSLSLENKLVVLTIGRVVEEKRLGLLVEAAKYVVEKHPNVVFVIGGEGPYKTSLVKEVKSSGLTKNFLFTGFIPDELLSTYYRLADVFAFPSTFEIQGMVMLEAMVSGLPCAVARAKPMIDLIEDGWNGYLFDPEDPADCARSIEMAIKNREIITRNAIKTGQQFKSERCADELLQIYRSVLDRRDELSPIELDGSSLSHEQFNDLKI